MVMQFGMTNAPADIQGYINNTIRDALDDFASAYSDGVLIYSNSEKEHVEYIRWIIQRLLEAGLDLKLEKCEFHREALQYLGLILSTKWISMDEDKVDTMRNRSCKKKTKKGRLNTLFSIQQFFGFCNNYQHIIPKYSKKAEFLTRLTKKDAPFVWELEQQLAYKVMVNAFMTVPVPQHFDHQWEVIIKKDASNYVFTGVFYHYDNEGVLHPVGCILKKHTSAECNYDIYDMVHLASIKALIEWRPECKGATHPLQLFTDH